MMKLFSKRITAVLLVLTLCVGMLAACGKQQTAQSGAPQGGAEQSGAAQGGDNAPAAKETDVSKMPVVKFMMATAGSTDNLPKVQEALNKLLAERYGIQCELHMEGYGSYNTQLNLSLTTPGEVDVFYISGGPATYVNSGMIYDITDLWANNASAEFKAMFKDVYIESNMIDGRLYAIPGYINFSNEIMVRANRKMMDEMGLTPDDEKIWTWEEVHDLVVKAKEKYPDIYGIAPQSAGKLIEQLNWESLGDVNNIGVVEDRGKSRKVISITDCKEFIEFSKRMRQWYQEGLIMQDILSSTESWASMVPQGRAFCVLDAGAATNGTTTPDTPIYNLTIHPNWSAANCAVRLGWGLAANTSIPEAAFTFLQACYMDQDVCNLLAWGIEGENYVVNEKGKAALPEGVTKETNTWGIGSTAPWSIPNMLGPILSESSADGAWDKMKEYDANAELSGCMGVVFDSTKVADEYTACVNAATKYYAAILAGTVDVDEALANFKKELEASGEAKVIAEKQAQIDAKFGK